MEPSPKRGNLTYVVVVGVALLWILWQSGVLSIAASQFPVEGTVVSVENSATGKEAIVQLNDGERITATIPAACVVFPGQIAQVQLFGRFWDSRAYTVLSSRDKQ
jgi:hypothetical protein